jgi:hypothetical protein
VEAGEADVIVTDVETAFEMNWPHYATWVMVVMMRRRRRRVMMMMMMMMTAGRRTLEAAEADVMVTDVETAFEMNWPHYATWVLVMMMMIMRRRRRRRMMMMMKMVLMPTMLLLIT